MVKRTLVVVGIGVAAAAAVWAFQPADTEAGLKVARDGTAAGYTMVAPLNSKKAYLVNQAGKPVHKWACELPPGNSSYLLPNGDLLRAARAEDTGDFHGGGIGGRVQRYNWDGELLWDYNLVNSDMCHHHDIEPLPNGNVLVIAWDRMTPAEAVAVGFSKDVVREDLWLDQVLEIEPQGKTGGKVVWQWRARDHLVQQRDKNAPNYALVLDHPGRIDCDYGGGSRNAPSPEELDRLRALGYVGGDDGEEEDDDSEEEEEEDRGRRGRDGGDWMHTNAIAYNAELDQIALSVHSFNEVWIIDHSTTTEQAAAETGGKSGRGGALLYRWGNPQAHRAGTRRDQRLFGQHDVRWVKKQGGGWQLSLYNNGLGRSRAYSSVDLLDLPLDGRRYDYDGARFGPKRPVRSYDGGRAARFYSQRISGAQVLPNGNLLVIPGEPGRIFEVNADDEIVWDYTNPYGGDARMGPPGRRGGRDRRPPPPGRGGPRGRDGHRGPGGPGGPGGGPGSKTALFRATRYPLDYEAFKNRTLEPIWAE